MELRCVGSMLEEVIAHWRRYDSVFPELEAWVVNSLPMAQAPEEERIEYFQVRLNTIYPLYINFYEFSNLKDVGVWEEKFQVIRDTVAFLVATCDPEVTSKIQADFSRVEAVWNQVFQQVRQYQHLGHVIRQRKEILGALSHLAGWLEDAERIVGSATSPPELFPIQSQLDPMDEEWRNVNRQFQALLPELSGEEVERLMKLIKTEKERLLRLRSQIPVRQGLLSSQLAEEETLRSGLAETSEWIRRAHELMATYSPVDLKSAQEILLAHRRYFSKMVYYRTLLESKRRFVEGKSPESSGEQVTQLVGEFQALERLSSEWEGKLNECVRCWRNYEENKETVHDWLRTAEKLLLDKDFKSHQALETHRSYFEQINERPLRDLVQAAASLRNCVEEPQYYESVLKSVEYTQTKWNVCWREF